MFISTKLKKNKRFYLFIYIFAFICERWKISTSTYSPKSIKWFILLPQGWNILRENLKIVNKSNSKKIETFVMFLHLRNRKCSWCLQMFLQTVALKFSRIDRKTSVSNKDLRPATSFKKSTQTQVFTCELCKILKSCFFQDQPWWRLLSFYWK